MNLEILHELLLLRLRLLLLLSYTLSLEASSDYLKRIAVTICVLELLQLLNHLILLLWQELRVLQFHLLAYVNSHDLLLPLIL